MMAPDNARVGAVVLAAGRSTRMGEPKQLLRIGGHLALGRVLETVRAAGVDEIVLVLGFAAEEIQKRIDPALFEGVQAVLNQQFADGMAGSLRAGLSSLSADTDAALIALADQPLVRSSTMKRIVAEYRASTAEIVIPFYKGQRGNPVLLGRGIFAEAMKLHGDIGCRALFAGRAQEILELEVDDPGILQDMDTRDDYERLCGLY